jgi:FkbM family methyltransferase
MKTFIQIGSNVGNDYFQNICNNLKEKSKIYLFEPNPNLIEQLASNYKNISDIHEVHILNKAILTENTKNSDALYCYSSASGEDVVSGLSSFLNRNSHQKIVSKIENIQGIVFNEFVENEKIKNIELLAIDTEGFDYEILCSIDLKKVEIEEILFEKWLFDEDDLDKTIRTGPKFLQEVLERYSGYSLSEYNDGDINYRLKRTINKHK